MEKALNEVKAIMDELNSLRDINLGDLDALGEHSLSILIDSTLSFLFHNYAIEQSPPIWVANITYSIH